jgi:lipopolysaccharide transport system ATP-binding protein
MIYAPVYAPCGRFREIVPDDPSNRTFVVIRDPRDTLVSWYFSLMYSHPLETEHVRKERAELGRMTKSEGLALMISKHLQEVMWIQREWIGAGARIFRYEDFVQNEHETFRSLFEFCNLPTCDLLRRLIVFRHSFRVRTWWRMGRENTRSHLRRGVPGDWKNHFSDDLKKFFKAQHGQTLALAGYEPDDSW